VNPKSRSTSKVVQEDLEKSEKENIPDNVETVVKPAECI